ncbi:MAG TPA: hypothetical protein VEH04_11295 [Verrucomicrobiae bacterium]|nr:hypothetical protein [Verrucomicrobiae bacterium]
MKTKPNSNEELAIRLCAAFISIRMGYSLHGAYNQVKRQCPNGVGQTWTDLAAILLEDSRYIRATDELSKN